MRLNQLGKSSIQVSEIGLGCMSLKGEKQADASLLDYAFDHGINYYDTADIYNDGLNETLLGETFKNKRDKVIIATKVGNIKKANGPGFDWNPCKDYILQAADKSLQRLKTDYIDLYQLHGGTTEDNIGETIEAFELLQQVGKIRGYGISSIRPNVIRKFAATSAIASVMMQYSLLDRRPEETCFTLLKDHNISVVARGALAQGLLVHKPAIPYLEHGIAQVQNAASAIAAHSGNMRTATQTAIRYVLQNGVASAVTGVSNRAQLQEVLATVNTPLLTVQEMEYLNKSTPAIHYQQHR